jgi:hypothetical protein
MARAAEKYQGWANYETWNVALWFDNERRLYDAVLAHPDRFTAASVKVFVKKKLPNGTSDFKAKGYAKVDWQEIADSFNEMRGHLANELHARRPRPRSGQVMSPRLDPFTRAYIDAALWSSTDNSRDDGGDPLDKNYSASDIAPETMAKMVADCADFQERFAELLSESGLDDEKAGYNFWLSRNGHGAGFFDDDLDALQKAAEEYGEFNLYIGDDGLIYGPPEGAYGVREARRMRARQPTGRPRAREHAYPPPRPARRPVGRRR